MSRSKELPGWSLKAAASLSKRISFCLRSPRRAPTCTTAFAHEILAASVHVRRFFAGLGGSAATSLAGEDEALERGGIGGGRPGAPAAEGDLEGGGGGADIVCRRAKLAQDSCRGTQTCAAMEAMK